MKQNKGSEFNDDSIYNKTYDWFLLNEVKEFRNEYRKENFENEEIFKVKEEKK